MASKKHVVLPGSRRKKAAGARRVGDVNARERLTLTIALRGPKLPGPDDFAGKTLDPAEFREKFAAKKADADEVAKALRPYGLRVDTVSLNTRSMRVSGTAAQIESAFKPGMVMMRTARHEIYRGRQGTIMIPAQLKGIVTGIFGLDQRRVARRKTGKRSRSRQASSTAPFSPADLEQRYNFPKGDGTGQTIAIAEFGGGYFADDLSTYCQKFQRSVPTVQAVGLSAPAYTYDEILALPPKKSREELGNAVEVMLDIQVIAGLCPNADLVVYFASFDEQGWVDLLNQVITLRPVALSVSWGLAEEDPNWSPGAIKAINERLNMARLQGITVCVASGDDGSGDQLDDGEAHVDFPSSSPHVLGVGGTMLSGSGNKVQEVCWWESPGRRTNQGGGATGGGVSMQFDRPGWQNVSIKSLNSGNLDGRIVPDVSALAGDPLYDLIFRGRNKPNGGTSASAPLWAALVARINARLPTHKQQRFLTPLLYLSAGNGKTVGNVASRNVTKGNNASFPEPGVGYKAGAGFNAVAGWGVPDGGALLNMLAAI
jgi:kumamolisin